MITPISYGTAARFVREHHRHNPWPPDARAHRFSLALLDGWRICGVVMVCRPVARALDDGHRLEVSRLCTDGTRNACSRLYAAAWRETRKRGYLALGTYTLDTEPGSSLRAAGWRPIRRVRARQWDTPSRRRTPRKLPATHRIYWEAP